ncbi:glucoamylase family protein [Lewinella sp. JB7]|uniref:glucoamylase family protein n=1 Tax=Lewinella sp. JB7 TaxID=2962887 RepID=UPI0020CA01EA|nr:glucoamylase family protein [Lewinella sp. JB7]MCP9236993.1 T9SS type A sorting domain-containing protein [Lewinella sp. JB7]
MYRQRFIRCGTLFAILSCIGTHMLWGQAGAVTGLIATAYDHHVELRWDQPGNPAVRSVRVYGSRPGEQFAPLGTASIVQNTHINFVGDADVTTRYFVRPLTDGGELGTPSDTVEATTYTMSDSALLDMVQQYTFRYFYDFGHPVSGLARERNTTATVTSGGSGFGLMALIVGAERGFISREEALTRTAKIVDFLLTVPRFRGAFAHWMNGATGEVIPFSARDDGGDLVETAFLLQGLLTSRQYFSGETEAETSLRTNINRIWGDVNWNWYRKSVENVLYWHWSPNHQFAINLPLRGFNEVQIAYILGVAAPEPAHRIPASLYHTGWAGSNYTTDNTFYGIPLLVGRGKGGPLFFSHYSYLGFDPRGKRDRYANYFERNTNQSLIQYQHAIENPYNREGYGPEAWGLTASDDPNGYMAHAPDSPQTDNGTLTPTAALSSMPYTPEESMAALKHFYRDLGDKTWGIYGFYDAFNPGQNWYADSYLAIDQGPIICMIENYRSGLLWDLFMSSPEIAPALEAIGFVEDSTTTAVAQLPAFLATPPRLYPNPAGERATLSLSLERATRVTVDLLDPTGRVIAALLTATSLEGGIHEIPLLLRPRPARGLYVVRISGPGGATHLPLFINQ